MDVEHYLKNNIWLILHDFAKKTLKSGLYFYENCHPVKIILRSHRSLSSVQDSVHGFITQLQKGIFLVPLNYWNVQPCRTLLRNWILIFLSWFGEKTLKSGLYFYEICPPVKIISRSHRSSSSVQDSVHGFITQLQTGIFECPWIIEMSNHVGHYWEHEFLYSFHDLAKKLWNPDCTFTRNALL